MSWVDKAHKKNKLHKEIEYAFKDPRFIALQKKKDQQTALQAFTRLAFLGCEFMEMRHGYKQKGLENFLGFLKARMDEIGNDETYFKDVDKYYKDEYDLDVMDTLGVKFEDDEA